MRYLLKSLEITMNKTYLVFKHEFQTTIRRTGFIVMTLIVPLIGILGILIAQIISGSTSAESKITSVGYVDNIGGFNQFKEQGKVELVPFTSTEEANKSLADAAIKEYFVITTDYLNTGLVNMYTLEKQLEAPPEVVDAMKKFLISNLLSGKVPDSSIKLVTNPLGVITTRLDVAGQVAEEQGGFGNLLIPTLFAVLLVLSISFSSGYLLAGLGDEKENRLIEVLLSSVSPNQLIIGKVLGLGVAGLAQIIIWVICAPILLNVASVSLGGFLSSLQVSPAFLVLCVVYFILGYLLNAVVMCAIGAISSSTREGQQLAPIFTLLGVSPLWFSSAIILYPDNPAFAVLTVFPFTAPVTLMLRMGASTVPAWQIILSIVVLVLSVVGGLFLTARIVRAFLLMYGKRPSLGEIFRSIRAG
jgi:ABC-2 type transport system permease protein